MILQLSDWYDGRPVLVNTDHLSTARTTKNGSTAIEAVGSYRTLWVKETPERINQLVHEKPF